MRRHEDKMETRKKAGVKKAPVNGSRPRDYSSIYLSGSASRLGRSPSVSLPSSSLTPAQRRRRHNEPLNKTITIESSKSKTYPRTRYLMKKYGHIWLRNIFGRVSPTVARKYYRRRLLSRVVRVWKEVWWEGHKEWKLLIRAECHDRYRLWGRVWRGWRSFVGVKRKKRERLIKARKFESKRVQMKYYSLWLKRLKEKKDLSIAAVTADMLYRTVLKRRAMHSWKEWKRRCDVKKERTKAAALHYNKHLINKYYSHWGYALQSVCLGTHHYKLKVLKLAMVGWREYVETRHEKSLERERAEVFHNSHLLTLYFTAWKTSLEQERQCQQYRYQRVSSFLSEILNAWKSRITYRHSKCKKQEMAVTYYDTKLKRSGLRGLQSYHHQQAHSRSLAHTALAHNTLQRLKLSWQKWLSRCEQSEDIKQYPLTRRAREHHSKKVYLYCWKKWRLFVEYKKFRTTQLVRATQHYHRRILPIYFDALRRNVKRCQYKRDLIMSSDNFQRKMLLSQFFYEWWRCCAEKREESEAVDVALEHYNGKLLKRFLGIWRCKLLSLHCIDRLERIAEVHWKNQLMSLSMRKWRKSLQKIQKSERHYNVHLMMWVWSNWRRVLASGRMARSSYEVAVQFWCRSITTKCVTAWKVYCADAQTMRVNTLLARRHYHSVLARSVLIEWRRNVACTVKRRRLLTTALLYQRNTLTSMCFTVWRKRMILKLDKRAIEDSKVAVLKNALDNVKLRIFFHIWLKYATERSVYKLSRHKGSKFNRKRLLRIAFQGWLYYHKRQKRQKVLAGKAHYFNKMRLLSMQYLKWRLEFMEKIVTEHQTMLALYHWGRTLQGKLLRIWFLYVKEKRRQEKRYLVAMDEYRSHLLVTGVTQWIEVASSMKATRCSIAMKQNIEANSRLWETVRKCASHWRTLTNRNRGKENVKVLPSDGPRRRGNDRKAKQGSDFTVSPTSKRRSTAGPSYWNDLMSEIKIPPINSQRAAPRCPSYLTTPSFDTRSLKPLRPLSELNQSNKISSKPHPPAPPTQLYTKSPPSPLKSSKPLSSQPRPLTPPTKPSFDALLSISTESGFHGNTKPHPPINSALLLPMQCKLLPPSAFTSKQTF